MDTNGNLTRDELHDRIRPANFNPADVTLVGFMDTRPPSLDAGALVGFPADMIEMVVAEFRAYRAEWLARNMELFGREYPGSRCEHCGAAIRWAGIVRYIPTGQHFIVGETCADERMTLANRAEHDSRLVRMASEAREKRAALLAAEAAWRRDHATEAAFLDSRDDRPFDRFIDDLARNLRTYGSLTEKQTAAITRNIERAARTVAIRDERDATAGPAPSGRATVHGTVVKVKWYDNDFGGTLKMVVRLDNGSAVFVSVPSKLNPSPNVGDVVTFTATFEVSNDDEHFAFGKRPTGASYESNVVTDPRSRNS